jgi:signal transduction histidine kinase
MIPTLSADKQLCLVIMRNLINNAIAFSHNDGNIRIEIHEKKQGEEYDGKTIKEDSLVFSVADTGIGIPEEDKEKIFSKLFRASNAPNEEKGGAGLNLFITKEIIENVGGDIWFVSTRDAGSTFYVAFPKYGMPKKEGKTIID